MRHSELGMIAGWAFSLTEAIWKGGRELTLIGRLTSTSTFFFQSEIVNELPSHISGLYPLYVVVLSLP